MENEDHSIIAQLDQLQAVTFLAMAVHINGGVLKLTKEQFRSLPAQAELFTEVDGDTITLSLDTPITTDVEEYHDGL